MRVVQLNAVCGIGSTGGITVEISRMLTKHNIENYILYSYGKYDFKNGIKYSYYLNTRVGAVQAKLLGNYGFNSYLPTMRLINLIDKIRPDIVHIHNIHNHDVNLKIFFEYLKRIKVRVIWTFHDCWAFTGYCMHFDSIGCQKWQAECCDCPQAKSFSVVMDRSRELYLRKKQLFTAIEDMTIVSPSVWLAELTKKSFLSKYPVEVINNGIDLDIFVPRKSDFRKRYGLENKKIVLGIPKGKLQYFIELSKIMNDDYKLVLVGLTDKEKRYVPENVLGLPHTRDRIEMAEIFTAADVYINTTLEDTFPTVNLEAQACGTPVITFDTGGSPEAVDDNTGMIVGKRNIQAMYEAVQKLCSGTDKSEFCIERVRRLYNAEERFNDYYELYCRTGRFG